jgi:hypothetical protein
LWATPLVLVGITDHVTIAGIEHLKSTPVNRHGRNALGGCSRNLHSAYTVAEREKFVFKRTIKSLILMAAAARFANFRRRVSLQTKV